MTVSSKVIGLSITIIVVITAIVSAAMIFNNSDITTSDEMTRRVAFKTEECSYGYAYLKSDSRTPSVKSWARIKDSDEQGIKVFSVDKNNPVELEVEINIPDNERFTTKYLKVVFRDVDNNEEYEQIVRFNILKSG